MIVQAYNDGEVAIFLGKKQYDDMLCKFTVSPSLKSEVDKHLRLLRMKRRTKWEGVSWGSQASVRFMSNKQKTKGSI